MHWLIVTVAFGFSDCESACSSTLWKGWEGSSGCHGSSNRGPPGASRLIIIYLLMERLHCPSKNCDKILVFMQWWDATLCVACTSIGQIILSYPYQMASTGIIAGEG